MILLREYSIFKRLISGFLLCSLLTLIVGVLGILATKDMFDESINMYDNQLVPIMDLANANMEAIYHNRTLYAHALESDDKKMDLILQSMSEHEKKYNALIDKYRSTSLTPTEKELLKKADDFWPAYIKAAQAAIAAGRAKDSKLASELIANQVHAVFQTLDNNLSELVNFNKKLAELSLEKSKTHMHFVIIKAILITAAAIVLSFVLGKKIASSINDPLESVQESLRLISQGNLGSNIKITGHDELTIMQTALQHMQKELSVTIAHVIHESDELLTMSSALATAAEQVATSSQLQSESAASSAAGVEQLSGSIDSVFLSAATANEQAGEAGQLANSGTAEVSHSAHLIREVLEGVNAKLIELEKSSIQIGSIAVIIKDVADQTNLLALNAAIEAARAGEQGRGFAVVADEVRKLAERTTHSAMEITSMVAGFGGQSALSGKSSGNHFEKVAIASDQTNKVMEQIKLESGKVQEAVRDISTAIFQQKSVSSDLAQNVEKIAQMAEENSAAVQEVASSSSMLLKLAGSLKQAMSRFTLLGA
ncbi:methyl-accepting chemotaxis protein [Iodobacter sp. CM08]|uniref:methyl-accepting chemotaxis protein n=1 Tax=Iodobacter sp. CM08 TaxID=3085902 RepID=UPI002981A420|nr:methyl-accepting chemotaxis protein [Iodobacter sp. CM08]MDW5416991.1 methyl-accepting chemotaxis protein [Iodobacter sp. CM08]